MKYVDRPSFRRTIIECVIIGVIDAVCIVAICLSIYFDIYYFCSYSKYRFIELLPFDTLIQVIAFVSSFIFSSVDKRMDSRHDISDDDVKKLSSVNNKPSHINLSIMSLGLLIIDIFAYVYKWKIALISISLSGILLLLVFVLPELIIDIFSLHNTDSLIKRAVKLCRKDLKKSTNGQLEKAAEERLDAFDRLLGGKLSKSDVRDTLWHLNFYHCKTDEYRANNFCFVSDSYSRYIYGLYHYDNKLVINEDSTELAKIKTLLDNNYYLVTHIDCYDKLPADKKNALYKESGASFFYLIRLSTQSEEKNAILEDHLSKQLFDFSRKYFVSRNANDLKNCFSLFNKFLMTSLTNYDSKCYEILDKCMNPYSTTKNVRTSYYIFLFLYLLLLINFYDTKLLIKSIDIESLLGMYQWIPLFNNIMISNFDETYSADILDFMFFLNGTLEKDEWHISEEHGRIPGHYAAELNEHVITMIWLYMIVLTTFLEKKDFEDVFFRLSFKNQRNVLNYLSNLSGKTDTKRNSDFDANFFTAYNKLHEKYFADVGDENRLIDANKLHEHLNSIVNNQASLKECSNSIESLQKKFKKSPNYMTFINNLENKQIAEFDQNICLDDVIVEHYIDIPILFNDVDESNVDCQEIENINGALLTHILETFNFSDETAVIFDDSEINKIADEIRKINPDKKSIHNTSYSALTKSISNAPDYIKTTNHDFFFKDGSIKFNFKIDNDMSHLRKPTNDELKKVIKKQTKEAGDSVDKDTSSETAISDRVKKNLYFLCVYGKGTIETKKDSLIVINRKS